jgi:hypothetical protein
MRSPEIMFLALSSFFFKLNDFHLAIVINMSILKDIAFKHDLLK